MSPELSVIVPCFNEELNVEELTRRVLNVFETGGFSGELILVDDGSSDGTKVKIEALESAHPGVVVGKFHTRNGGIAQGWRTGVAAARGRLVSIIDADLQYLPEDLLRLRRELRETNVDIVQGSRSSRRPQARPRYYYSRGLNTLLNATFGMSLHDNKSRLHHVRAGGLRGPPHLSSGNYYYWQSFIMVAAHAKDYTYKQIETLFERRRAGESLPRRRAGQGRRRRRSSISGGPLWEYRFNRSSRRSLRSSSTANAADRSLAAALA